MGSTEDSTNPGKSSYSLSSVFELIGACLDAVEAKTVLEVGAFEGDLTADLLDWAAHSGARVTAIDPAPPGSCWRCTSDGPSWSWSGRPAMKRWPTWTCPTRSSSTATTTTTR